MNEGIFWNYLIDLIHQEDIEEVAIDVDVSKEETHGWIGYIMPDNWKHKMIDNYLLEIGVNDIEKFIGDIGIRKAFRFADECEFYEEENYKEALTSDEGLRRLFYAILWGLIDINDRVDYDDNDYITEFNEEEYNTKMGEDDDDDEEEDYEFAVPLPITDEAFAKIGGGVAPSA
jgi:hypothetical protein